MKFSPSQLKAWQKCSLQAKYNYVDKIDRWSTGSSAHFGTSVHSALELFHNGGTQEEAIEEFYRYFNSIEPDYWNRRTKYTTFKDLGRKMIEAYVDTFKWKTHVTLASEFRFMVPFGDHMLSGIIDHMYTDLDMKTLTISDLKTGARPNMDMLHLDIQFSAYDYASRQKEFWCGTESDDPEWPDKYSGLENGEELFEIFQSAKRENIWYDLRKNQPIDVGPRTDFDYARLYRVAEQIARAVEFEVYVPTIDADVCDWCAYKDLCPVYFDNPNPVLQIDSGI